MNKNYSDIFSFAKEFNRLMRRDHVTRFTEDVIGIAPTYLGLLPLADLLKTKTLLMAQNVNRNEKGAFTGEISYTMLKEFNVNTVIVGHSEVRQHFQENDDTINKKIITLLGEKMTPVLCIGETLSQFQGKQTNEVLTAQLKLDLKDVSTESAENLVVAYEPIWAIGTGKTATNAIIQDTCAFIRKTLIEILGRVGHKVHLLYGGSVTEANAVTIMSLKNVDGVLVGGASLEASKFYSIIKSSRRYQLIEKMLNAPRIKTKSNDKTKIAKAK
jgi:triosephosphate isomerase